MVYAVAPRTYPDLIARNHPTERITAYIVLPNSSGSPLEMHFVEHLVMLGNLGDRTGNMERHANAWTSRVAVGYRLSGPSTDLPDLLKTLSRVLDPIHVPRTAAEEERGIILREYEQHAEADPSMQAAMDMDTFLYHSNAIARSPIGRPDGIVRLDYDRALALQAATHRSDRSRLVIVGDVTHRQVRSALQDMGWPLQHQVFAPLPFVLAAADTTTLHYPDLDMTPQLVWRRVVSLPEPVQFDLLTAQTAILNDILASGLSGGLAGPLRLDNFIAESFSVSATVIDERHVELRFSARPDRGVRLSALHAAFESALTHSALAALQAFQEMVGRGSDRPY